MHRERLARLEAALEERDRRYDQRYEERDRRYDERFSAQEKATSAALDAAQRAVEKAEAASEKRFEFLDEFRQTLADQTNSFIGRPEVSAILKAHEDKISLLENWRSKATGAAVILTLFAGVIGAAIVKAFGG